MTRRRGGGAMRIDTESRATHELDTRPFFVGIGSSAGGLEALTALLPNLPTGLGLRYVVVQHMSPTHRSMMAELLGRITQMTFATSRAICKASCPCPMAVQSFK
jgi:chemotaxis response regulator CheB